MAVLRFDTDGSAIPIVPLDAQSLLGWCEGAPSASRRWVEALGFEAKPGQHALVPGDDGALCSVLVGVAPEFDRYALGALARSLPEGRYAIADPNTGPERARLHAAWALGWALACYRFDRYKEDPSVPPVLEVPTDCDRTWVESAVAAHCQVRDLINTPAEDMGPEELGQAVHELAAEFGAQVHALVGEQLLEAQYRALHTVGRASPRAPRLLDLQWGDPSAPGLTLLGKGVCFDTGGLNLKASSSMRLMKKDMGGAAHAIGLARMVMANRLPVRLRLLICAVENSVSGPAYRPGDIIRARNGTTIEIDNTDAEGRVILCEALAEATAESPDLAIDFATLTGAARVALGTDLPAMFCTQDDTAAGIMAAGNQTGDPVWRMPLHRPYRKLIDSPVADIVNSAGSPHGGAIVAALFLQDFVAEGCDWVHFDIMAWNNRPAPGRPEGGEAMSIHALFQYLSERYAKH